MKYALLFLVFTQFSCHKNETAPPESNESIASAWDEEAPPVNWEAFHFVVVESIEELALKNFEQEEQEQEKKFELTIKSPSLGSSPLAGSIFSSFDRIELGRPSQSASELSTRRTPTLSERIIQDEGLKKALEEASLPRTKIHFPDSYQAESMLSILGKTSATPIVGTVMRHNGKHYLFTKEASQIIEISTLQSMEFLTHHRGLTIEKFQTILERSRRRDTLVLIKSKDLKSFEKLSDHKVYLLDEFKKSDEVLLLIRPGKAREIKRPYQIESSDTIVTKGLETKNGRAISKRFKETLRTKKEILIRIEELTKNLEKKIKEMKKRRLLTQAENFLKYLIITRNFIEDELQALDSSIAEGLGQFFISELFSSYEDLTPLFGLEEVEDYFEEEKESNNPEVQEQPESETYASEAIGEGISQVKTTPEELLREEVDSLFLSYKEMIVLRFYQGKLEELKTLQEVDPSSQNIEDLIIMMESIIASLEEE